MIHADLLSLSNSQLLLSLSNHFISLFTHIMHFVIFMSIWVSQPTM